MQKLLVAFLLLLFLTHSNVATAQSAPLPAQEGPVSQVEGSWQLTPLVLKGAQAPETNGQFQEFGETYTMENMLAFWARFGPGEKDWGLFSQREGKLSKVLVEDVEFVAPDSRKIKVRRTDEFRTRFHAGKRILYMSFFYTQHVYGWDGERLVRVLCAGDQLEISGVRYTVKRATVLDVGPDGRALIYYDANEPQHTNGWVLHDGASLTPLWKERDPLPGMPGVQIKNMSAGPSCIFHCVGAPKLLQDGTVLAAIEVTGAPEKAALFHIAPDRTEKISVEMTAGRGMTLPFEFRERRLGDLLVARSDSFVMEVSRGETSKDFGQGITTYFLEPRLLFYSQGKGQVASKVGEREYGALGARDLGFEFDTGMYLSPDSSRALVTLMAAKSRKAKWVGTTNVSFPGLYFWDGEKLSAVPWEQALGMDIPAVVRTLQTESRSLWREAVGAKGIRLRRISGPVSGVGVVLPTAGSTGPRWFVASNSVDGKLERPQFRVPGRTVTVADVVTWRSPEEALVELEDGYYLLTKAADLK